MVKRIDVKIGDKYNRLTIIEDIGYHITSGGNKQRLMKCQCDCGNIKNVTLNQLRSGSTKSCGCYNLEKAGDSLRTHGLSGTRLHRIWKDMKRRCNNPKRKNYKNYGGRGITICKEWEDDYTTFYTWAISNGYKDDLTIERIDVNGNYEPDNCTWITSAEQKSNTRSQKPFIAVSPDGAIHKAKVINHFAEEHNLSPKQISDCLLGKQKTHRGWKFERINEVS